jgi:putative MATE family efflux protein
MNQIDKSKLTEGPLGKLIIRMTIPMIYGMTGMFGFMLIETFFIGQLGKNELAAYNYTMPIIMLLNGLTFGVGNGVAAVISLAIGRNEKEKVKRLTTDSLVLGILLVGLFIIVGFLTVDPLFAAMGAKPEIVPLIESYIHIWYAGAFFVVLPMIASNCIRATGDTKTSGKIMIYAVIVNLVLDPILIFGLGPVPAMSLEGAAWASVLSRIILFVYVIWILQFRDKMLTLQKPVLKDVFDSWKKIMYIGLPQSATNVILPAGAGIIISFASIYGKDAVAGLGVGLRIEMFAYSIIFALGAAIGPIVGQNWGARRYDRVRDTMKISLMYSYTWSIFMAVIFAVLGSPIGSLFNDSPKVIETIALYLLLVPFSHPFLNIMVISNITINILHRPFTAAFLNILRVFIFYVPFTFIGSYFFGFDGLIGGISASNIVLGIVSYYILYNVIKKEQIKEEEKFVRTDLVPETA